MPPDTITEPNYPTCLPFEPKGDIQHLLEHFDRTPYYLFRTYAPRSNGYSDETAIQSAAVCNEQDHRDLFSLDRETAASMLEDHLAWRNLGTDNLMSWTSSFLYAIQHGIYRQARDFDFPSLSEIRICVVDTRKFERRAFLPANALVEAFNIPALGRFGYHGEYLSQGRLEVVGKSVTTSLGALISHGLYKLFPPFADEDARQFLYRRVQELRFAFSRPPTPVSTDELYCARMIAKHCFGGGWVQPMMAMLLSLQPRNRKDEKFLNEFRDDSWGPVTEPGHHEDMTTVGTHVPELRQLERMMQDLYEDQKLRQLQSPSGVESDEQDSDELRDLMSTLSFQQGKDENSIAEPVLSTSISPDGQWILTTSRTYLLLIQASPKTDEKALQLRAFRLSLSPNRRAQFEKENLHVAFAPARFLSDKGAMSIVTTVGPMLIKWSFRKILDERQDAYTITRFADEQAAIEASTVNKEERRMIP